MESKQAYPNKIIFPDVLFGRRKEQDQFLDLFNSFSNGNPVYIEIAGTKGIGKRYFVLHNLFQSNDLVIHKSRKGVSKFNLPYSGLADIFDQILLNWNSFSSDEEKSWKEAIAIPSGVVSELEGIIPGISKVLKISEEPEKYTSSPIDQGNRINKALADLYEAECKRIKAPVALFLETHAKLADETVKFIKTLINRRIKNLLIVLSHEHNGQLLDLQNVNIKAQHAGIIKMDLLSSEDLKLALNAVIPCKDARVLAFLEGAYIKFNGNFLLLKELLIKLVRKGQIEQDAAGSWVWKDGGSESDLERTEVKELINEKLAGLSDKNQEILIACACFGRSINSTFVSKITGINQDEVKQSLFEAVKSGLLSTDVDLDAGERDENVNFYFLHEIVQESLRNELSVEKRDRVHTKIVDHYLSFSALGLNERDVFETAYHLNQISVLKDPDLIKNHSLTNLKAAIRASKASSFGLALHFANQLIKYNRHQAWSENYGFASKAHIEIYKIARLNEDVALARSLFKAGLSHCHTIDQAKLYQAKLILDIQFGALKEALDAGTSALRLLGVTVPGKAYKLSVLKEFLKTKFLLRGKSIDALYNLPELNDSRTEDVQRIIFWMFRSAQYLNPELNGVLALKILQLMIKKGTNGDAYIGLMAYGVIIGAGTNNLKEAYEYCDLGGKLARKYKNYSGHVEFGKAIYSAYAVPIRETLDHYEKSRVKLHSSGDFISSAETTVNESLTYFSAGHALNEVLQKVEENRDFCKELAIRDFYEFQKVFYHQLSKLTHKDIDPNETAEVQQILKTTQYQITRAVNGVIEMLHQLLNSNWKGVVDIARNIKADAQSLAGLYFASEYEFYLAIALLKGAENKHPGQQFIFKSKAKRILRKHLKWTQSVPANYAHKAWMIEGLLEDLKGEKVKAVALFEKAIEEAKNQRLNHIVALATWMLEDVEGIEKGSAEMFERWRG